MLPPALAVLLPVLLASAAPAANAPAAAEVRDNVSITLIVGRVGGTTQPGERTYRFVGQDGKPARVLMGWRTPIPTRASDLKPGESPATSYVYQNIGLTADLQTQALGAGRFLVSGQIEISGVRESPELTSCEKPPLIGTFNQALQVVVQSGKKVRIAEGPDPEKGNLYLDLRVDLLE